MDQPNPSKLTHATLMQFADGELSRDEQQAVLAAMADDPQIARRVLREHELREAVTRHLETTAPTVPAPLRTQLIELAMQTPGGREPHGHAAAGASATGAEADASAWNQDEPDMSAPRVERATLPSDFQTRSPVLAVIGRWGPLAAAAVVLFAAILVTQGLLLPDRDGRDGGLANGYTAQGHDAQIVPASMVQRFARRHTRCTRQLASLAADDSLPGELEVLPVALQDRFSQPVPGLDLTAVGYIFDGVGRCGIPGQGAVHLIYRAMPETGRSDAISLWLRQDEGELDIEPGVIHIVDRDSAHPLLVWRQGGLIYYMLGDDLSHSQEAATAIGAPIAI